MEEPGKPGTPAGPTRYVRVDARAIIASVLLILGSVWALAAGGLPLLPERSSLAMLTPLDYVVLVGTLTTTLVTRYARWHFLLAPIAKVPFRKVMTIGAIGTALITFLPMRLGELARPALLRDKGRLSALSVTGTVGAERIVDGVVFSALLLGGLWLAKPVEPLPDHVGNLAVPTSMVPHAARLMGAVFASALTVMAAFYAFRSQARRATEAVVGVFSRKLAVRIADAVERLSDGFRILVHWRYTAAYLALTLIAIGMQVVAVRQLGVALGMDELTYTRSAVVLGVLAIGYALPNAPGFFGTAQLAFYAGLAIYVAPEKVPRQGATMVFLIYTVNLALVVFAAALALIAEFRAKTRARARVDAS